MRIAITGHRPNKFGNDYELKSSKIMSIKLAIIAYIEKFNEPTLISGMALGIDQLFALIAIEKKLPLIAAIPFKGQESIWPLQSKLLYNNILRYPQCKIVVVSEGGYSVEKMHKRNQWMVDNCDELIAIWDGTNGGTANCVTYATVKKRRIFRINPIDFK